MSSFYSQSIDENGLTITFDVIGFLRQHSQSIPDIDPLPGNAARAAYDIAINTIEDALEGVNIPSSAKIGPIPLPSLPGTTDGGGVTPVLSPQQILDQIVKAINTAEDTLNAQNFVISAGSVSAQLNLPFANVDVRFDISPKPYS